jgi:tetratricopeptide (TPR) repeat protein
VPLSRGSTLVKAELGHAYALAGRRGDALKEIDELLNLTGERHVSPFHLTLIYTGLGEKDRAIEFLNRALDERAERLVWLRACFKSSIKLVERASGGSLQCE